MKQIKKLQIGKNGLSEAFIEQVRILFEKEKVVKVSILKSACRDKKDADKIAQDLVSALGEKFDYKLVGYVITVIKFRNAQR
ncbi:YhbY family RNA-binding protein [Candidatus Pacearchaeota archaeon]|nr:YhbY family RNA-binding protein [Candidatus Pacearchaeota archaeon]